MRLAHPIGTVRRRVATVFLAALLGATALTVSQCRVVDENLTGVSLDRTKPDKCISKCAKTLADRMMVEGTHHANRMRECLGDPVCLAMENARFEEARQQILVEYRQCLNDCHHQGSGGGGR